MMESSERRVGVQLRGGGAAAVEHVELRRRYVHGVSSRKMDGVVDVSSRFAALEEAMEVEACGGGANMGENLQDSRHDEESLSMGTEAGLSTKEVFAESKCGGSGPVHGDWGIKKGGDEEGGGGNDEDEGDSEGEVGAFKEVEEEMDGAVDMHDGSEKLGGMGMRTGARREPRDTEEDSKCMAVEGGGALGGDRHEGEGLMERLSSRATRSAGVGARPVKSGASRGGLDRGGSRRVGDDSGRGSLKGSSRLSRHSMSQVAGVSVLRPLSKSTGRPVAPSLRYQRPVRAGASRFDRSGVVQAGRGGGRRDASDEDDDVAAADRPPRPGRRPEEKSLT
jgi:hypothetical protein